jgi:glycosyltransferase involved in cell wall biosynthesis
VLAKERAALSRARFVICNSERTRRDVVERLGIAESCARVVYYGTDPSRFAPPDAAKRAEARALLGIPDARRVVMFVGALGDRRKGFDALFSAWSDLCRAGWDDDLIVVGEGRELNAWRQRAHVSGLGDRVRFLGFRHDVHRLLRGADLLVHPARYEAYGLAVHEAICSGIPAIVSAEAGVAERYPSALASLLLPVISGDAVRAALEAWRASEAICREAATTAGAAWRARTWDDMADDIIALAGDC